MNDLVLVGDIGGTNARFGLGSAGQSTASAFGVLLNFEILILPFVRIWNPDMCLVSSCRHRARGCWPDSGEFLPDYQYELVY